MTRAPAKFTQAAVTRAEKGAIKAGLDVVRTEIYSDGQIVRIVLHHKSDDKLPEPPTPLTPYDAWKASNGSR